MAWPKDKSGRKAATPPGWEAIRQQVFDRERPRPGLPSRCQAANPDGSRCRLEATEVHHAGRPDDHRPQSLQALCHWHHVDRTAAAGSAAAAKQRAKLRQKLSPPQNRHPGLK